MHELSVSSAIVDTALRHCGGRRVTAVDARIGALRQVVPASLRFYFEIVARDTLCDGAELRRHGVAALLRCPACGHEWDPAPPPSHDGLPELPLFRCPGCGDGAGEIVRGNELEVESIEVVEAPWGGAGNDAKPRLEV